MPRHEDYHRPNWQARVRSPEFRRINNSYRRKLRNSNLAKALLDYAKIRARRNNLEFNLTLEDIEIPLVCPIFETPFVIKTMQAASLDRINPDKGYVKGNVQVISRLANAMKNKATYEQLKKFATWINRSTL